MPVDHTPSTFESSHLIFVVPPRRGSDLARVTWKARLEQRLSETVSVIVFVDAAAPCSCRGLVCTGRLIQGVPISSRLGGLSACMMRCKALLCRQQSYATTWDCHVFRSWILRWHRFRHLRRLLHRHQLGACHSCDAQRVLERHSANSSQERLPST